MVRLTDRPAMTIAVDMGRKAAKKKNNVKFVSGDQHLGNQKQFFDINQFIPNCTSI